MYCGRDGWGEIQFMKNLISLAWVYCWILAIGIAFTINVHWRSAVFYWGKVPLFTDCIMTQSQFSRGGSGGMQFNHSRAPPHRRCGYSLCYVWLSTIPSLLFIIIYAYYFDARSWWTASRMQCCSVINQRMLEAAVTGTIYRCMKGLFHCSFKALRQAQVFTRLCCIWDSAVLGEGKATSTAAW